MEMDRGNRRTTNNQLGLPPESETTLKEAGFTHFEADLRRINREYYDHQTSSYVHPHVPTVSAVMPFDIFENIGILEKRKLYNVAIPKIYLNANADGEVRVGIDGADSDSINGKRYQVSAKIKEAMLAWVRNADALHNPDSAWQASIHPDDRMKIGLGNSLGHFNG